MPIGPVSETGRAMMSSLQQAMAKGMPVDQAIAYVKGMATQGVAPMTDLYAMMNQFQRLKQPKVQAQPVPPTLKDQLGQLSAAQDVIDQGIGSLPAPSMERAQFAGGGIVAFADGGLSGIDFSKMSMEQLDRLTKDADPIVAKAATKELVGRFTSTPYDLASGIGDLYRKSWAAPEGTFPLVKFSNERKLPSYMYDEQGNVRKGEVTGGIAGTSFYSSSNPPEKKAEATPAAATTPGNVQVPAGATFDDMVAAARSGTSQSGTPYGGATSQSRVPPATRAGASRKDMEAELESTIPKDVSFSDALAEVRNARGKNEAAEEYKSYLDRMEKGAAAGDERSRNLALAKAGFAMAEAAGRRGKQRTGLLGAAAIGGAEYAAAQEKLAQGIQARQEKLAEAKFKLADAERREDAEDIRAAMREVNANKRAIMQARSDLTRTAIAERGQDARARIAAQSQENIARRYEQQAQMAARSGDLKSLAMLQSGILAELKDPFTPKAEQESLRALLTQIRSHLGSTIGGAGGNNPYSSLSDQDIMKRLQGQ